MIPGMDAAAAVSPQVARQLGAQFVCRYLAPYPSQQWKIITPGELRGLHDAGIPVVFNWESDGTPGNGWGTGVDAARQAQVLLDDRARVLGEPSISSAPVIFSFADTGDPDLGLLIAAHEGAASVLGLDRGGGYGGIGAIRPLFAAGAIKYGWQTYAWSGHGEQGGWVIDWHPDAQLRQVRNSLTDGVEHDYSEAHAVDFGQWPRPNAAPRPPAPHPQEEIVTPQDKIDIANLVLGTTVNSNKRGAHGEARPTNLAAFLANMDPQTDTTRAKVDAVGAKVDGLSTALTAGIAQLTAKYVAGGADPAAAAAAVTAAVVGQLTALRLSIAAGA